MINLKKTYIKVKNEIGNDLVNNQVLEGLVRSQHYIKGCMVDGTPLPPYEPSYIRDYKLHYRGFSDLRNYGTMHKSLKAVKFKNSVKVYVNRESELALYQLLIDTGKVWEHWLVGYPRIGLPFVNLLKYRNNLKKVLK